MHNASLNRSILYGLPGHRGVIQGIMENKTETTIVYWGYIGIMENKMETTIVFLKDVGPWFDSWF